MSSEPHHPVFAVDQIRKLFPLLQISIQEHPLVYLDNAATTQKPESVLAAMDQYYRTSNANVHRSAHSLAQIATQQFEDARCCLADLIGAETTEQVIWTRGTTEAINLVAYGWGLAYLQPGDEMIVSAMEHHANFVPWQQIANKTGAVLRIIPLLDNGLLDLTCFQSMLNARTKLVAVTHISNVLGTRNPVEQIIKMAHQVGALTLIDGAQAIVHGGVDVQAMDCDFYAFSAHKMFGPTGIGVLYGKSSCLEMLKPWQFGGEMIQSVTEQKTEFNQLPWRLEAGTPAIAEAVGFAAAARFLCEMQHQGANEYFHQLNASLIKRLSDCTEIQILGTPSVGSGVVSFIPKTVHPHDLCELLDAQGVAVRAGHHCAMPLLQRLGLSGAVRVSLSLYNTEDELERFMTALHSAIDLLHE